MLREERCGRGEWASIYRAEAPSVKRELISARSPDPILRSLMLNSQKRAVGEPNNCNFSKLSRRRYEDQRTGRASEKFEGSVVRTNICGDWHRVSVMHGEWISRPHVRNFYDNVKGTRDVDYSWWYFCAFSDNRWKFFNGRGSIRELNDV